VKGHHRTEQWQPLSVHFYLPKHGQVPIAYTPHVTTTATSRRSAGPSIARLKTYWTRRNNPMIVRGGSLVMRARCRPREPTCTVRFLSKKPHSFGWAGSIERRPGRVHQAPARSILFVLSYSYIPMLPIAQRNLLVSSPGWKGHFSWKSRGQTLVAQIAVTVASGFANYVRLLRTGFRGFELPIGFDTIC
jgi:hypothetical protein